MPHITEIKGRYYTIERLNLNHTEDVYQFYGKHVILEDWTYLPCEPTVDRADFDQWFDQMLHSADPYYLTIRDNSSGKIVGTVSLMRINPTNRTLEMGWVIYSHSLQKTRMATESQYLLMQYAFETLGYLRYEWKCDSLNKPSRQSALRLGFTFEGRFR